MFSILFPHRWPGRKASFERTASSSLGLPRFHRITVSKTLRQQRGNSRGARLRYQRTSKVKRMKGIHVLMTSYLELSFVFSNHCFFRFARKGCQTRTSLLLLRGYCQSPCLTAIDLKRKKAHYSKAEDQRIFLRRSGNDCSHPRRNCCHNETMTNSNPEQQHHQPRHLRPTRQAASMRQIETRSNVKRQHRAPTSPHKKGGPDIHLVLRPSRAQPRPSQSRDCSSVWVRTWKFAARYWQKQEVMS